MDTLDILNIIRRPVVTEKSEKMAANDNCYVFRVRRQATKSHIKKAVETAFGVAVEAVRIVNVKGRNRLFRTAKGRVPGWKKAYVTVKQGQHIDMGRE